MEFSNVMQHLFSELFRLMQKPMEFPSPIGALSPLDLMMFFAVAFMLAESVQLIASRRD